MASSYNIYIRYIHILFHARNNNFVRIFPSFSFVDEGFLELGAQWIHGEEQNAVFEMISSRDLHQHSPINFFDMEFARSSSQLIHRKIANELIEKFNQIRHDVDMDELNKFKTSGDYFKHK